MVCIRIFKGIKNQKEEAKPISISIGLFDSKKENIGTINYCTDTLQAKEEKPYELFAFKSFKILKS